MKEIRSSCSNAAIDERGAYVSSLVLGGREILMKSPDGIQTHGGMAILMPYANRVKNAEYSYDGKHYELPRNDGNNSIHGLTRDARWEYSAKGNDVEHADLEYTLDSKAYPSRLRIKIQYSISDAFFDVDFAVLNAGSVRAPLEIGAHPYMRIEGDWKIRHTEKVQKLNYSDGYFPDGTYEDADFNTADSLKNSSFDNCFLGGGKIALESDHGSVTLERRNMPYFVIYNGRYSGGESVALEPMTGAPDAYNNRMGIIDLGTMQEFRCGFRVIADQ